VSSYFDTLVCCYFAIARTPVLPRYSPSGIARGSCRALSLSLFSIHWKSYLEVLFAVVKLFPCPLSELSWSPPRSYLATPRSSIRLQSYLEVLYAQFWINETILSVHTAVWSFRGLICSYPEIFHALQSSGLYTVKYVAFHSILELSQSPLRVSEFYVELLPRQSLEEEELMRVRRWWEGV